MRGTVGARAISISYKCTVGIGNYMENCQVHNAMVWYYINNDDIKFEHSCCLVVEEIL